MVENVPQRHIAPQAECTAAADAGRVPSWYNPQMRNRLNFLRLRAGLTLEQLAELLGVSHATVQRWEKGKRNISADRVMEIATILKCHPGEFFAPLPSADLSPTQQRAADIAANLDPDHAPHWLQIGADLAQQPRRNGDPGNGREETAA